MKTGWNLIYKGEVINTSPLSQEDMDNIYKKDNIIKKDNMSLTYIPVRDCRKIRTIII